jgi:phosphate-selective porin OprO/OprP
MTAAGRSAARGAWHIGMMVLVGLALLPQVGAAAETLRAGSQGLRYRSDDGAVRLKLGGRLHYDTAWYDDDLTPIADNADVRRLRLELSGRVGDDWSFKIDRDVGGTSRGWKNVWLAWSGIDHLRLSAGNQIAPFGVEQLQSSNSTLLMERSLMSALTPSFLKGVQARYALGDWTATAGYFGDPLGDEFGQNNASGQGPLGRLTFAPQHRRYRTLHLGASIQQRSLDAGSEFRLRTRPESGVADAVLLDTGRIVDADEFVAYGAEGIWRYRGWSAQAEYVRMDLQRHVGSDLRFDGGYAQLGYVLTGESRRYSRASGTLGGIRPRHDWGALEVALRYSQLDLQDGNVSGGVGRNLGAGLNWYLNRNVALSANFIRARARPNRRGDDETANVLQLRAQIHF